MALLVETDAGDFVCPCPKRPERSKENCTCRDTVKYPPCHCVHCERPEFHKKSNGKPPKLPPDDCRRLTDKPIFYPGVGENEAGAKKKKKYRKTKPNVLLQSMSFVLCTETLAELIKDLGGPL